MHTVKKWKDDDDIISIPHPPTPNLQHLGQLAIHEKLLLGSVHTIY